MTPELKKEAHEGQKMTGIARTRNVFFSFHYADIMRVNAVRLSGEFKTEKQSSGRSIEGFYDKSLWESSKNSSPDGLKNLIRGGVKNTSAICILAGSQTFARRWVRYEIARGVIEGKGFLTVHINGIKDIRPPHGTKEFGPNPLYYLGIGKSEDKFYLCERIAEAGVWKWRWYQDYQRPVDVPAFMRAPVQGQPIRLSEVTAEYYWKTGSHEMIGAWIDKAAQAAGR
jgi:hypothetical protein